MPARSASTSPATVSTAHTSRAARSRGSTPSSTWPGRRSCPVGRTSASRRSGRAASAIGDLLARSAAALDRPPSVFVGGSAIGYYGDRGEEELDESSAPGTGVVADLCRSWEASAAPAEAAGIRVVVVRTGIVLGAGGALAPQLRAARLGMAAKLGSGRQWTSWISLADEVAVLLAALDDASLQGPVNATSPSPVRNAELAEAIATAVGRHARLSAPPAALRLALGRGPADEVLLASQRVLPRRLEAAGFAFAHPALADALATAISGSTPPARG